MALGQVNNMDIIPHTGTVMGGIVCAKHIQRLAFPDSNLSNIGDKVARRPFGGFAEQAAFMCANGIEVTQEDDVPGRISGMQVGQPSAYIL